MRDDHTVDKGSEEELFTHWLLRHSRTLGAPLRKAFDAMRKLAPRPSAPTALRIESRIGGLTSLNGVGGGGEGNAPEPEGVTVGPPRRGGPRPPAGLAAGR